MKKNEQELTPKQIVNISASGLFGSLFCIIFLISIHDKNTGDSDWFGFLLAGLVFLTSLYWLINGCKKIAGPSNQQTE